MSQELSSIVDSLRIRADWLSRIRRFFDSRGFLEVQTPVVSRDTVVDRYIEPIPVSVPVQGAADQQCWLQTSPEFCMKRLLAQGATAIYEITPAFRGGECGARHNIEFTMLEWYRVGDDYQAGMDLLDTFSQELLGNPPARRFTYRQVFQDFAGLDPFDSQDQHDLNQVLSDTIEPAISEMNAVIIYDWPEDQSALAKIRSDDPPVSERFELYVRGIELANGYHELTDPDELMARNIRVNKLRAQDGSRPLRPPARGDCEG